MTGGGGGLEKIEAGQNEKGRNSKKHPRIYYGAVHSTSSSLECRTGEQNTHCRCNCVHAGKDDHNKKDGTIVNK